MDKNDDSGVGGGVTSSEFVNVKLEEDEVRERRKVSE